MKVNILCHTVTNRLDYTLNFIFNELLGTGYTMMPETPVDCDGPVITYGNQKIPGTYHIKSDGLLFEETIRQQLPEVRGMGEEAILFPVQNSDHSFDVFSAVFYLVSRYEEYLHFKEDLYLRFPHRQSLAFIHGFLHYPLVNKWVNDLAKILQKQFPGLQIQPPSFEFLPTYDIDMAWAYNNKGFLRNLGGWIKSPGTARLKTLANLAPDPFDSFSFLNDLHKQYQLRPLYFWLVAKERGKFDRNVSPDNPAMRSLIRKHGSCSNGLHPSWFSKDDPGAINREKQTLEEILGDRIDRSRQHYLRFTLPETYEKLLQAGITDEYSMGYGTINGFRASTSSSFSWFNLPKNEKSSLRVHPFCFMDANSHYEQGQNAIESFEELMQFKEVCKKEGGTLVTIFHNNFLGTDPRHKGWREMYERFIQAVHP